MRQVYSVDVRGRAAPLPVDVNPFTHRTTPVDAVTAPWPADAPGDVDESGADGMAGNGSWRVLVVTSLITFMVSLEITIIALAFGDLQASFPNVPGTALSWIVTGYNIAVASFLLLAGWWADRGGRKRVFLSGVVVFALASGAAALAPSHQLLILARCIQGIGGAMIFPAGLALLLREFPGERRDFALGIWGGTAGLAAAVGPSIGGLLVDAFGWRSVFVINVPVTLLVIVLGALWLDESRADQVDRRVDLIGMPMAAIGVGLVVLAIAKTEQWGWFTTPTMTALTVGAVLVASFIVRCRRHAYPVFRFELFELRTYRVGNAMTVLFTVGFFAWLIVTPTFFQHAWGWSASKIGFAMAPAPILAMVTSPLAGILGARIGNRRVVAAGGIIASAGGIAHLLLTAADPSYVYGFLIPGCLLGIGMGFSFAPAVAATLRDVRANDFGTACAGRTTLFQLAVAIGVAVAIAIYTNDPGINSMRLLWMVVAGAFFLQTVVALVSYPLGSGGPLASEDEPKSPGELQAAASGASVLRPDERLIAMSPVR